MTKKVFSPQGFSLIELAIGLLVVSIAIIPVILVISGKTSGKSTSLSKIITQEKVVATTLMSQAAGRNPDFLVTIANSNILKHKNPDFEVKTDIKEYENSKIYYRWRLRNLTYSSNKRKQALPNGNYLVGASLEIFNTEELKAAEAPSLVMGTKVLLQEPSKVPEDPRIGIMLVVDMTPSMSMSDYGWGHNPMRVIDSKIDIVKAIDSKDYPVFHEDTPPAEVLNYLHKHCDRGVKYTNCFGTPYQNYKSADDFVMGYNTNNPETDFDERYVPSLTKDIAITDFFASPFAADSNKVISNERYNELFNGTKAPGQESFELRNSAISRIEMIRSTLYLFVHLLEEGKAGPTRSIKIGFLPFSNNINNSYMLQPVAADKKNKFPVLKEYIKSINRVSAPHPFTFDLVSNKEYTTDIEGALKTAHKVLLDDKSLNHRAIILITDWNHCVEIPKTIDTLENRSCIKGVVKGLQEEELKLIKILEDRKAKDPNYKPDDNDPIVVRLKEIEETKEWLLIFLPNALKNSKLKYQPYHPVYGSECKVITESPSLSLLAKEISEGNINNAHNQKTDIYIFALVDATRPPAVNILSNLTTFSENGEFIMAKNVGQMPELSGYLIGEINRLSQLKQAERYLWNRKK